MKHRCIYILVLAILDIDVYAQKTFNEIIEFGTYSVGFTDTIIYNPYETYDQFGYDGKAPLFLQIWHPLEKKALQAKLKYGAFRMTDVPPELKEAYKTLSSHMDEAFIDYNITNDFIHYEPIDYSPASKEDVLKTIKGYETNSVYSNLKEETDYPIIVYHHGAQGLSDENHIMAEYFASRGFIFVSANYHLAYEGLQYGMAKPVVDNISFCKVLTEFSRSLTNSKRLYYIGHSWGAQMGLQYLYEPGWADAFISLETTIEFKEDTTKIKELWPSIYDIIAIQKKTYSLPILMIANTGEDNIFEFFKNIAQDEIYFVTAKVEFGHESYTSVAHMRYLYNYRFPQPDSMEMKLQLELYNKHLKLIEDFISGLEANREFNTTSLQDSFFITKGF